MSAIVIPLFAGAEDDAAPIFLHRFGRVLRRDIEGLRHMPDDWVDDRIERMNPIIASAREQRDWGAFEAFRKLQRQLRLARFQARRYRLDMLRRIQSA